MNNDLLDQMLKNREKKTFFGKRILNIGEQDIKFWKPKEGNNHIDILQYRVATDNHPSNRPKGSLSYIMDIWQHNNIGINKSSFVCLQRTFNKPCPICEEAQRLRSLGNKGAASALYPSHRAFYNIIDLDNKEEGIQIFNVAYNLFEIGLMDEAFANSTVDGQGIIPFADLKIGYSITVRAKGTSGNIEGKKVDWFTFTRFDFIKRNTSYDSEVILKTAYSLDMFLHIPTYEEVLAEFKGVEIANEKTKNFTDSIKENLAKKEGWVNTCPYTHEFGKDFENYMECGTCDCHRECRKEHTKD